MRFADVILIGDVAIDYLNPLIRGTAPSRVRRPTARCASVCSSSNTSPSDAIAIRSAVVAFGASIA